MSLAESQKLLARLATDAALRAQFAEDPEGVAAEFGLSLEETRGLEALLPGPITDFAASLIRKRRGEVESLLPLTVRALGRDRFGALFRRHAMSHVPCGIKKHRDDAVAFAQRLAQEVNDPTWLADLAQLEATLMLAYDPIRRWSFLRLRYHPSDLAKASTEIRVVTRPTIVVWFRSSSTGPLLRWVLARPW